MIEISNLRKYNTDRGMTRLEADIKFTDIEETCPAETIYLEIREDCGDMFSEDTYDAFVLVPLYLAMSYKTDLKICGNVSKKFYKNLTWYVQKILCDFSSKLAPVKIFVEGFVPQTPLGNVIGAGISCGVDSFSTIYDHFVRESDPDYRINALFNFNTGAHGDFGVPITEKIFQSRIERAVCAANELHLPLIIMDTNFHQFRRTDDRDNFFFLSNYSCVLSVQRAIRRYYIASACTYQQIKDFGNEKYLYNLASFCDSYLVPLVQTERTELIIDGCQYRRVDKIKNIADWDIAQKYLNVCNAFPKFDGFANCGECEKCARTLLPLEILGKVDKFAKLFNMGKYNSFKYRVKVLRDVESDAYCKEIFGLAEEMNFPMPTKEDCYVLGENILVIKKD